MPIETTRRGFLLLVGTLVAAGAFTIPEPEAETRLQFTPRKFGYLICKDGEEFARFVEGAIPDNFEFEVQHEEEVFFVASWREVGTIRRAPRYLHMGGKTYLARDVSYRFEPETNTDWLVVGNIAAFDFETDRLEWVLGRIEPVIVRG
jgi:hypothetical protein